MPTTYAIPNGRTVMDATTYTGTGSSTAIVNAGGFKPDLVWVKNRNTTYIHNWTDSVRGISKILDSASTAAELNDPTYFVTAFNSNGFTQAGNNAVGSSGNTYVGWQWQAGQGTTSTNTSGSITSTVSVNATAGFSIVSYTGTLTAAGNATIGHGLGVAPSLIISKRTTGGTSEWVVQTPFLGQNKFLILNSTGALQDMSSVGAGTLSLPTSTTFGSTYYTGLNVNTQPCIAYCWAQVAGFSQFGSYTGNGSTDGPFIYTGFRPKFIMLKRTDAVGNWFMLDSARNLYNVTNTRLTAENTYPDDTDPGYAMDFLSNGIKLRSTTNVNISGATYIYMAFAENPFKYANAR